MVQELGVEIAIMTTIIPPKYHYTTKLFFLKVGRQPVSRTWYIAFKNIFLERTKQKSLDGNENNTEIGVIYHARLGNLVARTNRKKRND